MAWGNYVFLCVLTFLTGAVCVHATRNDTENGKTSPFNATISEGIHGVQIGLMSPVPFILVFMEHDSLTKFNFNIACMNLNDTFSLRFHTADTSIIELKQQKVIEFSCIHILANSSANNETDASSSMVSSRRDENGSLELFGNFNINLYGSLIGKTALMVDTYLTSSKNMSYEQSEGEQETKINDNESLGQFKFPVVVIRKLRKIDYIFQIFIYIIIVLINLAFGCKLDLEIVKASLKKPIAVSIGLVSQYIVMPMIGFGIAKIASRNEPIIALGIFLAGCCPGGGMSNIYSHLLNGNLALSITMTAISNTLALVMFPFWLYTLGQQFINNATDSNITVPFLNIFTTLLVLIVPLIVGVIIKHKLPKLKRVLLKIMTPCTIVAITVLVGVGIFSNLYIFKLFRPKVVLAGSMLPYVGFVCGAIISALFRQPWKNIKTIALETGFQNVSIAYLILLTAFPPPEGELAAIAPIAAAVMSPLPPFVITIIYIIYKKCNPDKYKAVPDKNTNTKSHDIDPEVQVMACGTEAAKDRETDI